mmetsp:Transcript_24900/g.36534  ORF Transcript_24900/g.36534 Transcript_24900/m.36534 type:complete len:161 (+) Transcript_24900:66-548(+)|eukprot:CAMPEP_0195526788 /NCGR_PEP_ID=MMETSP0794_2-20130614/28076_1 /TAXON_ID=515487 /ORGANISM="Stephanopyxis turris, Strain CCMP 815" /LENGTH=160 /DNA_ID=CAMNT_0040657565 /DNA_START=50 /DNA_END=532 /DNA_ORIENTATION=-
MLNSSSVSRNYEVVGILIASTLASTVEGFSPSQVISRQPFELNQLCYGVRQSRSTSTQVFMGQEGEKKGMFGNFFEELDNFIDDATSRRLGAGSAFYGKRKSSFYGDADKGKKANSKVSDPTEDYNGPSSSGYFKWIMDEETGQMKPVSRMKEKNLEKRR